MCAMQSCLRLSRSKRPSMTSLSLLSRVLFPRVKNNPLSGADGFTLVYIVQTAVPGFLLTVQFPCLPCRLRKVLQLPQNMLASIFQNSYKSMAQVPESSAVCFVKSLAVSDWKARVQRLCIASQNSIHFATRE